LTVSPNDILYFLKLKKKKKELGTLRWVERNLILHLIGLGGCTQRNDKLRFESKIIIFQNMAVEICLVTLASYYMPPLCSRISKRGALVEGRTRQDRKLFNVGVVVGDPVYQLVTSLSKLLSVPMIK
jgi:hypothetical protein